MSANTFLAGLRKAMSPANQALLDAIADDTMVQGLIDKAEQNSLTHRHELAAELAALPAKHAKAVNAAYATLAAATTVEEKAQDALAAARTARTAAWQQANGLQSFRDCEGRRIETELLATAGNLLVAAHRAVTAFSPAVYAPGLTTVFVPNFAPDDDPWEWKDYQRVSAQADAENRAQSQRYVAALGCLAGAQRELQAMKLEALTEAAVAERVSVIFDRLNASLVVLKDKPRFTIDEHLCVVLKFGRDQTAFTVKPGDIAAEVVK